VEEVFPSYRPNFALGKKPGDRDRSHAFLQHPAVMIRVAKETFASSAAAEQQRAKWRVPVLGAIRGEKHLQVVAGGLGITKLKLNRLAFLHHISDGNSSPLLVRSYEVAHKKIATLEAASMLIDRDANV
jgi:hypothetical protein